MWENAYLSTENPRASRARSRCIWFALLTCLDFVCSHHLALLHWQFLALEGIFHFFQKIRSFCHGNIHILSCTYIHFKLEILKKGYQEKWENAYVTLIKCKSCLRTLDNNVFSHSANLCCQQISKKFAGPRLNPGSAPAGIITPEGTHPCQQ